MLKIVSPGYFRTLSVRPLRSRVFTDDDRAERPGVVLVNEAFARFVFRGEDPIGRHLTVRTPSLVYGNGVPSRYEIVGVVRNVHSRGLDVPAAPAYYLSVRQFPQALMTVYVRTDGTSGAAGRALPCQATLRHRSAVRSVPSTRTCQS